jgi:hypothetical protein
MKLISNYSLSNYCFNGQVTGLPKLCQAQRTYSVAWSYTIIIIIIIFYDF